MTLRPGSTAYIDYDSGGGAGYGTWHERLVLAQVGATDDYAIATPDFDVYIEQLSLANGDIVSIRFSQPDGGLPVGVNANDVYGFGAITVQDRQALMQEGRILAQQEMAARGIAVGGGGAVVVGPVAMPLAGPPGAVPPPVVVGVAPVAVKRIVGAGGAYVLDEPHINYDVGTEFGLPAGALRLGNRVLLLIDGEESTLRYLPPGVDIDVWAAARTDFLNTDRRIQPCPSNGDGKTVPGLLKEMSESPHPRPSTVDGPRVAPYFLKEAVLSTGMNFLSRHTKWKAESGVRPNMPLVYEHEVLSHALDLGIEVDRLNVMNLTTVEWMCRRLQLQEHAVLESPDAPSFEGAEFFMGMRERRGGAIVAPSLSAHVASETSRETAILKEKRKARESRESMKNKDKNKGRKPQAQGEAAGDG